MNICMYIYIYMYFSIELPMANPATVPEKETSPENIGQISSKSYLNQKILPNICPQGPLGGLLEALGGYWKALGGFLEGS